MSLISKRTNCFHCDEGRMHSDVHEEYGVKIIYYTCDSCGSYTKIDTGMGFVDRFYPWEDTFKRLPYLNEDNFD